MRDAVTIRPEGESDRGAIGALHTEAFADDGRVARLVDALWAGPAPLPPVSLVAVAGDQAVGHVLLTASRLDTPSRLLDVYVLSPLGVRPAFQRAGIGTALVAAALAAATERGQPLVFLEGSPGYYGRRGFERADACGFRSPSLRIPPPGFQVARLPGCQPWMTGSLVYADAFWAHDCVGLREGDPRLDALRE